MIDPVGYWQGGWKLLTGRRGALDGLDFSRRAFWLSFIALLFGLPIASVAAFAAAREAALVEASILPLPVLAVPFLLASLSFAPLAIFLAYIFKRSDAAQSWITLRHWLWLAVLMVTAAPFGLYLIGILPYEWAVTISSLLFISIIWVDFRLIGEMLEINWMGALASACIFSCGFLWTLLLSGLFISYVPLSG